jgi:PPOX class probable F420-dependent enzyme
MSAVLPDPSTPFGERVAQRLRDDPVIWLTTVGADGTPQPNPVWFLWDGESFLTYNRADAKRLAQIKRRVGFNIT